MRSSYGESRSRESFGSRDPYSPRDMPPSRDRYAALVCAGHKLIEIAIVFGKSSDYVLKCCRHALF